jgi:hypothetical protein
VHFEPTKPPAFLCFQNCVNLHHWTISPTIFTVNATTLYTLMRAGSIWCWCQFSAHIYIAPGYRTCLLRNVSRFNEYSRPNADLTRLYLLRFAHILDLHILVIVKRWTSKHSLCRVSWDHSISRICRLFRIFTTVNKLVYFLIFSCIHSFQGYMKKGINCLRKCFCRETSRGRLHLRFGYAAWMCVSTSHAFWMHFLCIRHWKCH